MSSPDCGLNATAAGYALTLTVPLLEIKVSETSSLTLYGGIADLQMVGWCSLNPA